MRFRKSGWACIWVVLLAACQPERSATIHTTEAWARATPTAAPVAGAFMTIVNDTDQADRLLAVESDVAEQVEIHEMRHENGMMRMRKIEDGLALPAHGRLELKPGGYHLMLISPSKPLEEGGQFSATLVFANAGRQAVHFDVRALGAEH